MGAFLSFHLVICLEQGYPFFPFSLALVLSKGVCVEDPAGVVEGRREARVENAFFFPSSGQMLYYVVIACSRYSQP